MAQSLCVYLLGNAVLNHLDAQRPIMFIAGGTGFAPVKAMIEQLLANADPRPFELFWGADRKVICIWMRR